MLSISPAEPISAFDTLDRTGTDPADHLIGAFDYLNASARPEAARVRALVDRWLADYPEGHRAALIARLRSRDDQTHRSAHFELFLHALMIQRGHRILAVEPEVPGGRAPDYLVEAPDGSRFYLEATLATGMAQAEAGADRRMREALQAIDDVVSPDFFLQLSTRGTPDRPVSRRKLRAAAQKYVDGLDHAAAVAAHEAGQQYRPLFQYEAHGAHFRISAVPKNARGGRARAIGGRMLAGGAIQPQRAIRSSVERKAAHYGRLDLPLVIAVNALDEFARPDDAEDALYGMLAIIVPENGAPRRTRTADSAWRGQNGPVYTRSSAVLFVERLSPWSVAQRTARLLINPWATHAFAPDALGLTNHQVIDNRLVIQDGPALRDVFRLTEGWPELE